MKPNAGMVFTPNVIGDWLVATVRIGESIKPIEKNHRVLLNGLNLLAFGCLYKSNTVVIIGIEYLSRGGIRGRSITVWAGRVK
jgi:hypothetical protein